MYIVRRSLTFVRGFFTSYGPTRVKQALWNKEFTEGKWNFIDDTAGDCVYLHLAQHANHGDILDLGCGPGNTANELSADAYRNYIGVDISEAALAKARKRTEESGRAGKNSFVASDFLGYQPTQEFDVILFRESLYHVPYGRVLTVLHKFSKHLKSGGVFMVRLYLGDIRTGEIKFRVKKKIDLIKRNYQVVEEHKYDLPGTPTVLVFRPTAQNLNG